MKNFGNFYLLINEYNAPKKNISFAIFFDLFFFKVSLPSFLYYYFIPINNKIEKISTKN
jgi:hypothetical protein